MIFSLIQPTVIFANKEIDNDPKLILLAINDLNTIDIYENIEDDLPVLELDGNIEIELLEVIEENDSDFAYIHFKEIMNADKVISKGYIKSGLVILDEKLSEITDEYLDTLNEGTLYIDESVRLLEQSESSKENLENQVEEQEENPMADSVSNKENSDDSQGSSLTKELKEKDLKEEVEVQLQEKEATIQTFNLQTLNVDSLFGIAQKNVTHVYDKESRNSKSLKSYKQGSILKYTDYNSSWYAANVYINGVKHKGFIHKDDVENSISPSNQKTVYGVALKGKTHVYTNASTSSKSIRSYPNGSVLKYKTYSKDWYVAKVYIEGEPVYGYIHKSHVENVVDKQKTLYGVVSKDSINVYTRASRNSEVVRSYDYASKVKFQTLSNNWYEAKVYINGDPTVAYIHRDDVSSENVDLYGYAKVDTLNVYKSKNRTSSSLKSYSKGARLKFIYHDNNWFYAKVKVNGKYIYGYIHRSDISFTEVSKLKIFIDAGHGGTDPGASGNGLKEKDLTLDIAKRIEKYLKKYSDVEIKMSRTKDITLSNDKKVETANKWEADFYFSVHINSFTKPSAHGFESFIWKGPPTKDEVEKQKIIHENIVENMNFSSDRGKKQANFQVLRETNMTAMLVEYLFITNKNDSNNLKNSKLS